MKVKEFFESNEHLAVHCDTEDKAKTLLKAFDREGYKWCCGTRYINETCWEDYKENTCYNNKRKFCSKKFYQDNGYTIIDFEDIEI